MKRKEIRFPQPFFFEKRSVSLVCEEFLAAYGSVGLAKKLGIPAPFS